jgi:hypothetical protein
MTSTLTLAHVLADVGVTYRSIDVRIVAYRIGAKWYSLIMIVRFSELDQVALESKISELWGRLTNIQHERFRILKATYAYDDRQHLFDMFKSGICTIGELCIRLGRTVDLLSDMGWIKNPGFGDPLCCWPHLEVQGNRGQWTGEEATTHEIQAAVNDADVRRYLSTRGYDSPSEAIALFLGLRQNNLTSFSSEIYTWAPIFAKIASPTWNADHSVTIAYKADPLIKGHLWLTAKISEEDSEQRRLTLSSPVPGETEWDMAVRTEPATEKARIDATLVHNNLGIIANSAFFVRGLIPVKDVNPMWHLLQRFCSIEEFARLLATPGAAKDSPNMPQRLFELRISWVLAAYGFSCFVLGPHEYLRDPGVRLERGSLDLLAFHETKRVLLLGSCKTNAPKESDYDNLVNVRALLIDDLEGADSFETHMVIFTAAAETRLYKKLETSASGWFPRIIPIFDANRLRVAMDALERQQTNWFFEQLTPANQLATLPSLSPLPGEDE